MMLDRSALASSRKRTIVILAYDQCHSLDVTGPFEVFMSGAAKCGREKEAPYRVLVASPSGGEIVTISGLALANTVAIQDVAGPIDTVLVAGGSESGVDVAASQPAIINWLQNAAQYVRRLGSVCTGTFLLAEAGLLDGRRATTHWESCDRLAARYPAIVVDPDAIYVSDPPIYTSAGVSAGIDLALALMEEDIGQPPALAVARDLVLFLRRPGGQSQFSAGLKAQAHASSRLRELIAWMVEHPTSDLRITALADRVGMSERNFARVFRGELHETPAQFAEAVRVERAKLHLEATDWPLSKIAAMSGFGSVDSLHRSLRRRLGITPLQYRERFAHA